MYGRQKGESKAADQVGGSVRSGGGDCGGDGMGAIGSSDGAPGRGGVDSGCRCGGEGEGNDGTSGPPGRGLLGEVAADFSPTRDSEIGPSGPGGSGVGNGSPGGRPGSGIGAPGSPGGGGVGGSNGMMNPQEG
jgi:hypothetical protein